MTFPFRFLSALMIFGLLSACAVDNQKTSVNGLGLTYQSTVKPQADGSFYVEAEAAPLAGRTAGAKKVVIDQAVSHCAQTGKKMTVVDLQEGSNMVVNGVSKLRFKCS
jgi:hypothetical protein